MNQNKGKQQGEQSGCSCTDLIEEQSSLQAHEHEAIAQIAASCKAVSSLKDQVHTGLSLKKPFAKSILLLEDAYIAGTSFVVGIEERLQSLAIGCRLKLVRDKKNLHDTWAIRVYNPKNEHIGFVASDVNEIIARLMDAGKCCYAKAVSVDKANGWNKVKINVYLDD